MTRYGMKFSTIRYWQDCATKHVRYTGDAGVFQRQLMHRVSADGYTNRAIAYAAIQAAAVMPAAAVKVALKG